MKETSKEKRGDEDRISPGTWQERKRQIKHRWTKPFVWVEWLLFSKPVFKFFQLIAYIWIMYGIFVYYQGKDDRIKQKHYQAWQTINLAQGKTGSGGRIQALEDLNKDHVSLCRVDLSKVWLHDINLIGAYLANADLTQASLRGADLQYANLEGANLTKAYLYYANLTQTNFWRANLTQTNFLFANLTKANLTEANLLGAFLLGANLRESDLRGAFLLGAGFQEADLRGITGITIKQLSKVRTLYKAKLDPEIEEQIRGKYPHLLEEPNG